MSTPVVNLDRREDCGLLTPREWCSPVLDLPVFADFAAEWCGNCEVIKPHLEQLVVKYSGKAIFLAVDLDENEETAQEYLVDTVPRLILFKNSEK